MDLDSVIIREARADDLPGAARLAARLVRLHHDFDPQRFAILSDDIEGGYERWFGRCIQSPEAVVLVAESAGEIVGYAYGQLEPRNWNDLLDSCGMLHDVYVGDKARGNGTGERLVNGVIARLAARGAQRIVLKTAARNSLAQRLFERIGFRRTMVEMTLECPVVEPDST